MTETITGLFDTYAQAKDAVARLENAGVPHDAISIVSRDKEHAHLHGDRSGAAGEAVKGAEGGAVVGAAGGLLAGLGVLAIPGIGPVVAAGWLVATAIGAAGGAAVGAAAGGLVGAFTKAGVPEHDAHVYAEGVRRGGTVVSARVDEPLATTARGILNGGDVIDVQARREAYVAEGWSRFDENAPLASPAPREPAVPTV